MALCYFGLSTLHDSPFRRLPLTCRPEKRQRWKKGLFTLDATRAEGRRYRPPRRPSSASARCLPHDARAMRAIAPRIALAPAAMLPRDNIDAGKKGNLASMTPMMATTKAARQDARDDDAPLASAAAGASAADAGRSAESRRFLVAHRLKIPRDSRLDRPTCRRHHTTASTTMISLEWPRCTFGRLLISSITSSPLCLRRDFFLIEGINYHSPSLSYFLHHHTSTALDIS